MTFTLLEIDIHKNSDSYISIFGIAGRYYAKHIFYIEWNYNKRINFMEILGYRII